MPRDFSVLYMVAESRLFLHPTIRQQHLLSWELGARSQEHRGKEMAKSDYLYRSYRPRKTSTVHYIIAIQTIPIPGSTMQFVKCLPPAISEDPQRAKRACGVSNKSARHYSSTYRVPRLAQRPTLHRRPSYSPVVRSRARIRGPHIRDRLYRRACLARTATTRCRLLCCR